MGNLCHPKKMDKKSFSFTIFDTIDFFDIKVFDLYVVFTTKLKSLSYVYWMMEWSSA